MLTQFWFWVDAGVGADTCPWTFSANWGLSLVWRHGLVEEAGESEHHLFGCVDGRAGGNGAEAIQG